MHVGLIVPQLFVDMAQGVAEIQEHPVPGIPLIPLHKGPLVVAAGVQDFFHMSHQSLAVGAAFQEGKELLIPQDTVLDHLGQAVPEDPVRQRVQGAWVDEHRPGLVEGSGQVLPLFQVHGHLSAHGGIHLGQKGGGNLDEGDPPEQGGRREAGHIPGDAAAQGHDKAAPGHGRGLRQHPVVKGDQDLHILALFPGGKDHSFHGESRLLQGIRDGLQIQRGHVGVGDDADLASGIHLPDGLPAPGKKALFKGNDVASVSRQGHGKLFHGRRSFRKSFTGSGR